MPERLREKWFEKYRAVNVDNDHWAECILEEFKEDMSDLGVNVFEIQWSGFWSQGDGASFAGSVSKVGIHVLLPHLATQAPISLEEADSTLHWRINLNRGHYCHEMCMQINDSDCCVFMSLEDDDPLVQRAKEIRAELASKEIEELSIAILEFCREKARELYSNLEKEYDYQTDEAQVIETCANSEIGLDYLKELEDERDEC